VDTRSVPKKNYLVTAPSVSKQLYMRTPKTRS
jgi:hypothetical protein